MRRLPAAQLDHDHDRKHVGPSNAAAAHHHDNEHDQLTIHAVIV
jgi:hypothetical protein